MSGGFELLEHTADVGIRSWGSSMEEAFEHAAWGLAAILGAVRPGPGEAREVRGGGSDPGGLLVDFLNELLFLHETEQVAFAAVRVRRVGESDLEAEVRVAPLPPDVEGTPVKAATYHQLRVDRDAGDGVTVQVFVDV